MWEKRDAGNGGRGEREAGSRDEGTEGRDGRERSNGRVETQKGEEQGLRGENEGRGKHGTGRRGKGEKGRQGGVEEGE